MKNPFKTIKEARRQAETVLSSYEISFAVLASNSFSFTSDFDEQLWWGLAASFDSAWWERPRFRRKLRKLHAKALERVEIRRAVMSKGLQEIALAAWPKEIETR